MLRTAWHPLRESRQIRAKQSADFPHGSVYSSQNHVDTSFSNMSGIGSHKWVWGQARLWSLASASEGLAANDTDERWRALCQGNVSAAHNGWTGRLYTGKRNPKQAQLCGIYGPRSPILPRNKGIIDEWRIVSFCERLEGHHVCNGVYISNKSQL